MAKIAYTVEHTCQVKQVSTCVPIMKSLADKAFGFRKEKKLCGIGQFAVRF